MQLTTDEQKTLQEIQSTPYMKKGLKLIEKFVRESKDIRTGCKNVFDEIFRILNDMLPAIGQ